MTPRELDKQIAEKVFGLETLDDGGPVACRQPRGSWALCPFYSTAISDAWQVVEAMQKRGYDFSLQGSGYFYASFQCGGKKTGRYWSEEMPEAICLAALSALDGREK
jgi:hypothetical protein